MEPDKYRSEAGTGLGSDRLFFAALIFAKRAFAALLIAALAAALMVNFFFFGAGAAALILAQRFFWAAEINALAALLILRCVSAAEWLQKKMKDQRALFRNARRFMAGLYCVFAEP